MAKVTGREVTVAMIGAAATIIGALISRGCESAKPRLIVEAIDAVSSQGLGGATVTLRTSESVATDTTDDVGRKTFSLPASLAGSDARVRIEKPGYVPCDQELKIPKNADKFTCRLKPEAATQTQPPGPQTIPRVFSSGPKLSGSGAAWSDWYSICSESPPPGYSIGASEFRLSGDRSCGAWAECRATVQNPSQVCWEFRMQGHNEWPPPGQANSEGQLVVTYTKS